METLEGIFTYKVFPTDAECTSEGYSIRTFKKTGGGKETVTGYNLPSLKKITYILTGEYVQTKYGKSFKCTSCELKKPDKEESIIAFLSSGYIKGIGEKTAKLIYEEFKDKTFDILEFEPERLATIKGISKKKAQIIAESYKEHKELQVLSKKLSDYGITPAKCGKIAQTLGSGALDKIDVNPYILTGFGISFEIADAYAMDNGLDPKSDERFLKAAEYVLHQGEFLGNTGMELMAFGNKLIELLGKDFTGLEITNKVTELLQNKTLVRRKISLDKDVLSYIFSSRMAEREGRLAADIRDLSYKTQFPVRGIGSKIADATKGLGIELDPYQKDAVKVALNNPISVICGPPGTGKTTIEKVIANIYKKEYPKKELILLAPTGRAARRMEESTGLPASTIHSYLKIYDTAEGAENKELPEIEDALLIVDEFSMVDTYLAGVLFSTIKDGVTMVIVGDPEQLPSVGPGAVLRDIINSGICPVTFLEKIHRQDMGSMIYQNSHKIRKGDTEILDGTDFKFHNIKGLESCKDLITKLYLERLDEYGIDGVMVLLPYKKYVAGVEDMNKHLQSIVNPESIAKKQLVSGQVTYRVGDPVMHINCNKADVSNGDIGRVSDIKMDGGNATAVIVKINGKRIEYERSDLDNLTLAYACTVHKSQGSESAAVITCITDEHTAMLYRNIPYVAVSRGKQMVDLIGNKAAIDTAIKNYRSNSRITLLSYLLSYAAGNFVAI